MSRTDQFFKPALAGKQIPILTLDNKWHQLFTQAEPNKEIMRLEEKLNELLREQGKASSDLKEIKKLKKKLMQEIMENAEDASLNNNEGARKKTAENTRLINECNEKIENCEDILLEMPREIDRVNKELMLATMEICYDRLQRNEKKISETAEWIAQVRVELKKRLIRKQEMEQMNQELYTYMHNIFGPDVIEMFDMKFQKEE